MIPTAHAGGTDEHGHEHGQQPVRRPRGLRLGAHRPSSARGSAPGFGGAGAGRRAVGAVGRGSGRRAVGAVGRRCDCGRRSRARTGAPRRDPAGPRAKGDRAHGDQILDPLSPGRGGDRAADPRTVGQVDDGIDPALAAVGAEDPLARAAALGTQLELHRDPAPVGRLDQQVGIVAPLTAGRAELVDPHPELCRADAIGLGRARPGIASRARSRAGAPARTRPAARPATARPCPRRARSELGRTAAGRGRSRLDQLQAGSGGLVEALRRPAAAVRWTAARPWTAGPAAPRLSAVSRPGPRQRARRGSAGARRRARAAHGPPRRAAAGCAARRGAVAAGADSPGAGSAIPCPEPRVGWFHPRRSSSRVSPCPEAPLVWAGDTEAARRCGAVTLVAKPALPPRPRSALRLEQPPMRDGGRARRRVRVSPVSLRGTADQPGLADPSGRGQLVQTDVALRLLGR